MPPRIPEPEPTWRKSLALSKDLLPWLMLAFNLIYGFGVRVSTSDRTQQQQLEDHVALQEVRTQLSDLSQKQSALTAKLDMLVTATFNQRNHSDK